MKIVEQIKQPIATEMELFEKKFLESMSSKVALLNRITYYIVNRKGKQMRPMFVFLTAKMISGGVITSYSIHYTKLYETHLFSFSIYDIIGNSIEQRHF